MNNYFYILNHWILDNKFILLLKYIFKSGGHWLLNQSTKGQSEKIKIFEQAFGILFLPYTPTQLKVRGIGKWLTLIMKLLMQNKGIYLLESYQLIYMQSSQSKGVDLNCMAIFNK